MAFLKLVAGAAVVALAAYGLVGVLTDLMTDYGKSATASQTAAAWFQAIGVVLAIAGAFYLSDRQSKNAIEAVNRAHALTLQTKIDGHLAVVDAAIIHARSFAAALASDDVQMALIRVYDPVVARGAQAALTGRPTHELGKPAAVVPLLSMRDQFVFVENSMELFRAGPFKDPELSNALDTLRGPGDAAEFEMVRVIYSNVLRSNVGVHLTRIEDDYRDLCQAMNRTPLPHTEAA